MHRFYNPLLISYRTFRVQRSIMEIEWREFFDVIIHDKIYSKQPTFNVDDLPTMQIRSLS